MGYAKQLSILEFKTKKDSMIKSIINFLSILLLLGAAACNVADTSQNEISDMSEQEQVEAAEYAMVIHGGAGTILKENMTPEKEKAFYHCIKYGPG